MRCFRSRDAARVNEMTKIEFAGTPLASNHRTRSSMVKDFPVPGPATNRIHELASCAATCWRAIAPCLCCGVMGKVLRF